MALLRQGTSQEIARGFGRRVGIPGLGIVAATLVAAAALLPVAQSSSATSTGHQIRDLETRRADLTAAIYVSQSDLATLGSIDRIEREARGRLGMIPAERWMYVTASAPPPVALMPARYLNTDEVPLPQVSDAAPWWRAALTQIMRR